MTPEEWEATQQSLHNKANGLDPKTARSTDPSSKDDGGFLSSMGAGFRGATREFTGDTTADPSHPTAEWVGRQTADWGPLVALDAFGPEVPMAGVALKYAPRAATFIQKGLTGAYKGAIGGEWMQPKDRTRGEMTGALTGAGGGMTRAAFNMLPWWAKMGLITAAPNAAGLMNVYRETTGQHGGYISPWSLHHALSALGGLAAAAAGMPATAGGATSAIQNTVDPPKTTDTRQ